MIFFSETGNLDGAGWGAGGSGGGGRQPELQDRGGQPHPRHHLAQEEAGWGHHGSGPHLEVSHQVKRRQTAIHIRVQWFSTFFRFYHMGAFHDLDLLVLRPLKKKKFFVHPPLRARSSKFSFSKNHRDLNNEYFFMKISESLIPNTPKNNRQK